MKRADLVYLVERWGYAAIKAEWEWWRDNSNAPNMAHQARRALAQLAREYPNGGPEGRQGSRYLGPVAANSREGLSARGSTHTGCGGVWVAPDPGLEAAFPGIVDKCNRCGEERA